MEFGLAVAAAIVNNGLDHEAIAAAVKAELSDPSRWLPEVSGKKAA
jgi:hypothetical protein